MSPEELTAIVARLNSQPAKEVKTGCDSSQTKAVTLIYQKDAAKGFKEVYIPVKRVQLNSCSQTLMLGTQQTRLA